MSETEADPRKALSPGSALPSSLAALLPAALAERLAGWGEPAYRAKQIFHGIHAEGRLDPAQLATLPKTLRARLATEAAPATRLVERQDAADGTTKVLLGLHDGRNVEAVFIPERGRLTVCVSTQVGCPVRCVFCASGVAGLLRDLTAAEIVEPLVHARALLERRPSHIVLMGMGEPLLNLANVAQAIRIWTHAEGLGLSPRRITVSTALVPAAIERLAALELGVNLAVSLHAGDDETRARLLPGSPPGRTAALVDAAAAFAEQTGRDATVEYVLIAGENDALEQADRLGALVAGRHVHVNLIPLNPVGHRPDLSAPETPHARAFLTRLRARGASATLRTRRGDDIAAACGQLALERALGKP